MNIKKSLKTIIALKQGFKSSLKRLQSGWPFPQNTNTSSTDVLLSAWDPNHKIPLRRSLNLNFSNLKMLPLKIQPAFLMFIYILTPILISSAAGSPLSVKAQNIYTNFTKTLREMAGFLPAPEGEDLFMFKRETPNYTAYAGKKSDFGGHLIRIERDGQYIEFSLARANLTNSPGKFSSQSAVLSSSSIATASGSTSTSSQSGQIPTLYPTLPPSDLSDLSSDQKAIMENIDTQLEDIQGGLSSISGAIKGVQTDVQEISHEVGVAVSKATLEVVKNERIIKFADILPDTDIKYSLNIGGIKEEIVINQKPIGGPPNEYVFLMTDTGFRRLNLGSGVWYFYGQDGALFRFPKGWAKDAKGVINNDVQTTITEKNGQTEVSIFVPPAWLASPDRVYPITIDPTIEVVPEKRQNSASISPSTSLSGQNSEKTASEGSTLENLSITPSESPATSASATLTVTPPESEESNPTEIPIASPAPTVTNTPAPTITPLPSPTVTTQPDASASATPANINISVTPPL